MDKLNINDILLSCEVELTKKENFNVIIETLERIGYPVKKINTLFQQCHILHKMGKFYIVHYKEMYALDGKHSTMTYEDLAVRNLIATILENWKLIKIVKPIKEKNEPIAHINTVKILSHEERLDWILKSKYLFACYRKKKEN